MNILKVITKSFNDRLAWTVWSLLLCPFFYVSLFIASVLLALINLSVRDGVEFWRQS